MTTNDAGTSREPEIARLLVVDDDPDVRGMLVTLLRREGYHVDSAAGTDSALEFLARGANIELVITDLHMPGRDGIALLKELRSQYPGTGAVMVTGDGDVAAAVECLKLGAIDYLTKPLVGHAVRACVAKALAERRVDIEIARLRAQYQDDLRRQVNELAQKNKLMFLAQVRMAVTMLEAKDPYTRGHSRRVAEYAVATGKQMGLDPEFLEEVRLGGELHDIGKIGTRDAILNKPGTLSDEEFAHVREHASAGEAMLSMLRDDHPEVLHITRWHHERLDGSGFPDRLKGDQIPLSARIISVVDAFDAMTSHRSYRTEHGAEAGLAELQRCAGTQFDPEVVAAFLAVFPELPRLPIME